MMGPDQIIWENGMSNELAQLAQGNNKTIKGTNTITFVHIIEWPIGQKRAYIRIVVDIRTLKAETHWSRVTLGGDKID